MTNSASPSSSAPLAMLVEDDPLLAMLYGDAFRENGWGLNACATVFDALNYLDMDATPDCLITDIQLADGFSGWELARLVRERLPFLPVYYVTGVAADEYRHEAVPKSFLIEKPISAVALAATVVGDLQRNDRAPSI